MELNDAIKYFNSKSITETNDLIKVSSVWVAEQIGLKKRIKNCDWGT